MTGAPLQDALLDEPTLAQLLFDIEHAGQLIGVVIRPLGARRRVGASPPATLEAARQALEEGTASVQLRYRFGGEEWWDTLLPAGHQIRLVRISHTRALVMGE